MTKRFKTLMRGGKFMRMNDCDDLIESEYPQVFDENESIESITNYYRRKFTKYDQWVIDEFIADIQTCELVTIEVKVVKDVPELTDKTSSE